MYLTQGIRNVCQCDLAKSSDPEGEILLSYMNKRAGEVIFFHLKTVYLSDMKDMGKIPILHGQKLEKNRKSPEICLLVCL